MSTYERAFERTQSAFLQAGIELILAHGYDAVSVRDIADAANYGRSTFYIYFKDKEDLAWSILRDYINQTDSLVVASVQDLEPTERLLGAWKIIFLQVDHQRSFFQQLDGEFARQVYDWHKAYLIEMLEKHLQSGFYHIPLALPIPVQARFVVGTLLALADYWLENPNLGDADALANMMFDIVVRP